MALIKCPDCGKEFSDSAKQCPNCGYKHKTNKDINFSLIGGWILSILGLFFAGWATLLILWMNPWILYYNLPGYIFALLLGIASFITGCFLISKQYSKRINKISYIVGGVILLINLIFAPISYNSITAEREFSNNQNTGSSEYFDETASQVAEYANPNTLDYYIGTWEYTQPNNQDGLQSIKFVVNPDETVQAIVEKNGKEIIVYGSYYYLKNSKPNQIHMHFNDTEEHINGILYIDHLRIFKGYNDYFGVKYGQIKTEENGKVYLYEEENDADAKNPNKRVELTKID